MVEKHKLSHTKLYHIRENMLSRCNNKNARSYDNYGGRGVKVATEWLSFNKFYIWALENGYKEGLQIDRIDFNGDYTPTNCRWVTVKKQQNNKRSNRIIYFNNMRKTVSEWADFLNVPFYILHGRLGKGWSEDRTLGTRYEPCPQRRNLT